MEGISTVDIPSITYTINWQANCPATNHDLPLKHLSQPYLAGLDLDIHQLFERLPGS
jgi:hypothetical protein